MTSQPAHIAGDAERLTPRQREWIARAAAVGRDKLGPRAARWDREASFPQANFDDLRAAGLLAIAVPKADGGEDAGVADCMLVAAELGRWCASTALCWSMHVAPSLWIGPVADALDMTAAQRADHEARRARQHERIVRGGALYSQPFSEGGAADAGKAPWATIARKVEGGYRVDGRKIFASLAGAATHHAVTCTLERADQPEGGTQRDAICLAVPADAPGVSVIGDWDPLGMRGTVSRTLVLHDVFVPDSERLLPEGLYHEACARFAHMHALTAPTYLGIAQAAYDFAVAYLRGELPGMAPVKRRMYPTKQLAVAQMRLLLEQTRALFVRAALEARIDPDADARMRLLAAQHAVMENAQAIAALAVRTCGGQSLHKGLPLERLYRDSRCGSLMLPWTAELCLDRLGRGCLYETGEGDEAIEP